MEDSKYYTPSIDEFYVGFEYEELMGTESSGLQDWSEMIFDVGDYIGMDGEYILPELIEGECIRCKYLDKSDIESCGFICEITSENYLSFFKDDLWLQLTTIRGTTKLAIKDQETFLFIGTIKNINELHKLLKQLGIE